MKFTTDAEHIAYLIIQCEGLKSALRLLASPVVREGVAARATCNRCEMIALDALITCGEVN